MAKLRFEGTEDDLVLPGDVVEDLADGSARVCGWCEGEIPARARRDAKYCSVRCRQAAHRFQAGRRQRVAATRLLRFGYADPPYPRMAKRYYGDHPDFAGEVDHVALVARLVDEFPDGWALSTSAAALRDVLSLCPSTAQVGAWVRGDRPSAAYAPLSSWEPVIYVGGRAYMSTVEERRIDSLVYASRARMTEPRRVTGAKPGAFCWWLFDLLGALPGDEFIDLFPGSGGVAKAWRMYTSGSGDPRDASCSTSGPTGSAVPARRVVLDVGADG